MANQIEDNFAAIGLPALQQMGGEAITFDPASGDDVPLTAIVHGEEFGSEYREGVGTVKTAVKVIEISNDAAAALGGVASLRITDRFTIGGRSWAFRSFVSTGAYHAITLSSPRVAELTRESHRRR